MSKIEEVAKAIYETWAADGNSEATWDELLRMQKQDGYPTAKTMYALAFKEARAAIEAMRTPSIFMLRRADNAIISDERFESGPYESDKFTWETMIDAALSEKG